MSTERFTHPQATHAVQLGEARVAYLLVRSARRTVGLEVSAQGLTVRAPLRASLAQIQEVVLTKSRWVLGKLVAAPRAMPVVQQQDWRFGAQLPYLGSWLRLVNDAHAPQGGQLMPDLQGEQWQWALHVPLPAHSSAEQLRAAVTAWWLRQARAHLQARLDHLAPLLGVQWRSLRLTNARTRWGSAKRDGSIMLNWRLLHFAPSVVDYVVAHELAHLRVMDHSPRFWAVVAEVCPDYAAQRQQLRVTLPQW